LTLENSDLGFYPVATWFRKYAPHDAELARLEAAAKNARAGLWSEPNPAPPWDWRHGEGVPETTDVIRNGRSHVYDKPRTGA
jgi:hypothetical protein